MMKPELNEKDIELWSIATDRVNVACLELRDVCAKFGMNHTADAIIEINRELHKLLLIVDYIVLNLIYQECLMGD